MSFEEFITLLERRVGFPISAAHAPGGAIVGLLHDPLGAMLGTELTLPGLIEAETCLSLRLLALGAATIH